MAKRLIVLVGMLAVMLAVAVPALAQQQGAVTATGVLGPPDTSGPDPEPTYPLTDEGTGTTYELTSGFVELEPYVGQRVAIEGVRIPGINPRALNVTEIQPVDGPPPSPAPGTSATFDFELTVKGEPPAGARFFGVVPAEGCISAPLADPDGDGVFTGSVDVPRFAPGPVPPDAQPVSLPVQIVQANSGAGPCNPTTVIKDFGIVPADDDTFRARVNFKRGPVSPEEPTDECLALSPNPEECDAYAGPGGSGGGSDNNAGSGGSSGGSGSGGSGTDSGSSDSGGSGSGNSGGSSDSGSSGSGGSGSGGSGNDAESSGAPSGVTSGIRGLLPSTGGGMALTVLVAGVLLVAGGLLVRRAARQDAR